MTFKYFSGFSLENEKELFEDYLVENDLTVSGFSYGAIKAFDYALTTKRRVDLLQLFSPAFFETKDEKFKRMQLMYYKKDEQAYCNTFLQNVSFPSKVNMKDYYKEATVQELEELLYYKWDEKDLEELLNKGTRIEVYLGQKDKIIDTTSAKEFFEKFATVYFIKEKGHILK
ncbi:pimelyl-ACP methyl ester esterase BioV [Halarcobacter sp.]|uniref:pimelyl-ACP methyl ester esterase BioV n=1 Tax=Halarcobacter sp. TaxID=2321133 RepID=UPI003A8E8977